MKLNNSAFYMAVATVILALSAPIAQAQTPPPQAQQPKASAPAYYIAEFELTDPEGIKPYRQRSGHTNAYIVEGEPK